MEGQVTALGDVGARRRSKNEEMPPPTKRADVGASATSVGMRSTLRTSTMAYAEVLSSELATVKSEELRKVRCWPK